MRNLLYLLLVWPVVMYAQTNSQNYIKTLTYKDETSSSNATKANATVIYFDGLGRPIQQIAGKQSGIGKDIITHIAYDEFGRQSKEYLPYAATTDDMAFDASAEANTLAFYNTFAFENTTNPYSENFFDSSPLGRVMKQGAPGTPWLGAQSSSTDHTVKYAYLTNNASDAVKKLTATAGAPNSNGVYDIAFVSNGTYAAGKLYKTITQNENKAAAVYTGTSIGSKLNTTEEYKNMEGQLLLKRTFNQQPGQPVVALDTYYVYDQYGNLTYVLPPLANGGISQLDKLCYQYKYDSRNRLIEKKLPGKTWEFMVYDKLDRIVATGPAINPWGGAETATGWMITQYDAFGRVAFTGWRSATGITSASRKGMQDKTYNWTSKTTSGTLIDNVSVFYANSLPSDLQSGFKLLSVNYYDNYVFPNAPTAPTASTQVEGQDVLVNCRGLLTGTWVRALVTQNTTPGETTFTFYDYRGRPIRTRTTNYLEGYTEVNDSLGFDGRVLHKITKHKRTSSSTELVTRDDLTYTDQDRLLSQTHTIVDIQPAQLMTENTYNAIGQLIVKKVGNTSSAPLQNINYAYNIRGWLESINVPNIPPNTLPAPGSAQTDDLFRFSINYNGSIQQSISGNVVPLYNGNISEITWQTSGDNIQRRYGFTYDKLNRMTDAWYQMPDAAVSVRNSYDEHLTYDANGNITSLQRNGEQDSETLVEEIDELTYTYDGNQLQSVTDSSTHPSGFNDLNISGNDYEYDGFGNMKFDKNKGITTNIMYNHLNLPVTIVINDIASGGTNNGTITYLYNAAGVKLKKTVTNNAVSPATVTTTDYLGDYQYVDTILEFFPTSEGYVKHTVSEGTSYYNYVFQYKDHLGNNRLSYMQDPNDNNALKILEEDHYYPFGLKHEGYSADQRMVTCRTCPGGGGATFPVTIVPVLNPNDVTYKYMYNGKELQNELGLNNYDYGWRQYDPAIGRFNKIDRYAEKYYDLSTYSYAGNNPVFFIDVQGDSIESGSRAEYQRLVTNVSTRITELTAERDAITAAATRGNGRVRYNKEQQARVNELNARIGSLTTAQNNLTAMYNDSNSTFRLNAISGTVAEIVPTAADVASRTYTLNYIEGDVGNEIHEVAVHGGQILNGDIIFNVDASGNVITTVRAGLTNIDLEVSAYQAQYSYGGILSGHQTPQPGSPQETVNNFGQVTGTDKQVNAPYTITNYGQVNGTLVRSMQRTPIGHNPLY